ARAVLPETLRAWGARVDVVAAYRTTAPADTAALLTDALAEGLDAVTFTASSTVTNLMALLSPAQRDQLCAVSAAGRLTVASIGPVTSATARDLGLTVHVEPAAYTIPDLVAALADFYRAQ
ncbi:MAG: uroporphyrinogen-III synthase, partial [Pseudomonadota bacterium]